MKKLPFQIADNSTSIAGNLSSNRGHVHLVGVCGIGMAGVAALLKGRGFEVTGCDNSSNRISDWLAQRGIRVQQGHSPEHIDESVDWIVRSTAVNPDSEEIREARAKGIPVFLRGEVLPRILDDSTSVAVSGTHGKTTTSAFIAQVLKETGLSPSWCIGGEIDGLGGVAGTGESQVVVAEADESDGTVALYKPDIAVITNIEFDHMEHFSGPEGLEGCFSTFAQQAKKVIFCLDDPRAHAVCKDLENTVSYGMKSIADISAANLELEPECSRFTITIRGEDKGQVCLPVPGIHNVLNALATTAVATELGVGLESICDSLSRVALPKRRFERVVDTDGILVISDYAHHPTEIAALIKAARPLSPGRLIGIFQPHRYTRTKALRRDFPGCFMGLDELVLVPVYPASEPPLEGGLTCDLYEAIRNTYDDSDGTCPHLLLSRSPEHAWEYIKRGLREGDVLLVIGAGDIERVADRAREELGGNANCAFSDSSAEESTLPSQSLAHTGGAAISRKSLNGNEFSVSMEKEDIQVLKGLLPGSEVRSDEHLDGKTAFRVGGTADIWVEIGSEDDLATLLAWTNENGIPLTILGGGFNVVVSDLGIRGVVARLSQRDFSGIRVEGNEVVAGASVGIPRMVKWAKNHSLAGLEFLNGIPGTIGGAVRMNAGAWGKETGNHLSWIRCLKKDGCVHIVEQKELETAYRDCLSLHESVLIEAAFLLKEGELASIEQEMAEALEKRTWMPVSRCAGSVFKNPQGDSAGRLLEEAGMKSARIGGAVVSAEHANVLVTEEHATASDVEALICRMQAAVAFRFGVELEPEVKILG